MAANMISLNSTVSVVTSPNACVRAANASSSHSNEPTSTSNPPPSCRSIRSTPGIMPRTM